MLMKLSQLIFRKEQSTEAYKNKTSRDINNIETYETRTKANTTKCRPIYEVIDEAYIKYSKIFQMTLLKNVWIIQTKHMIYESMQK